MSGVRRGGGFRAPAGLQGRSGRRSVHFLDSLHLAVLPGLALPLGGSPLLPREWALSVPAMVQHGSAVLSTGTARAWCERHAVRSSPSAGGRST